MLSDRDFYERQLDYHLRAATPRQSIWRTFLNRLAGERFDVATSLMECGGRMLDVGSDRGLLLSRARPQFRAVYGIDISLGRIAMARDRVTDDETSARVRSGFVCGNANAGLPFADSSFSCVCAYAILEHIFDVYGFLNEVHRVLEPGGHMVLEVPNIAYLRHRIRLLLGRLPITSSPMGWKDGFGWDGGHLHYFTAKELRRLLGETGFDVEAITTSGGTLMRLRNIRASLLAGNIAVRARKPGTAKVRREGT